MANILIVEDDDNVRLLLKTKLGRNFEVTCAKDGGEALDVLGKSGADLVITDIMMPGLDGFSLVESMRGMGDTTPVIMLTAKSELADKGRGFSAGCDDYMTKPVNFDELLWRINALLRRYKIANDGKITIGEITVDRNTFTVTKGEETFELTSKEFRLLFLLLSYPGRIFTKENILDSVWGYASESDESTVRTHINRLRNKFEHFREFEICTIRGVGYKAVIKNDKGR